jgi:hypothetical protein
MMYAMPNQQRRRQISHQLQMTQKAMQTHALTSQKWGLIQVNMQYVALQMRWSLSGPNARLLMAFHMAFLGAKTDESAAGLFGPTLSQTQALIAKLMSPNLPDAEALIENELQLMTLIVTYLTTQTLGRWKEQFPRQDPAAAKRAKNLLQDLGLTWLLGSHTIESLFGLFNSALEISKTHQAQLNQAGLFYILMLVMLLEEEETERSELIIRFIAPQLETLLQLIEKSDLDDSSSRMARHQIETLRLLIDQHNPHALHAWLKDSLELGGISTLALQKDIKNLIERCAQLHGTFNNLFSQTAMTHVHQSA